MSMQAYQRIAIPIYGRKKLFVMDSILVTCIPRLFPFGKLEVIMQMRNCSYILLLLHLG